MTELTAASAPPRVRKPRGSYAKTAEKRLAILDAALEVFSQGYHGGSLRDIAARVGMSEAGLLHHFKSKSALLMAVLDHRDEHSRSIVDLESEDGADALRGLVALARYNQSVPGVVELFCVLSAEATAPDHPAHDYFTRRYVDVRTSIRGSFERVAAAGRLRGDVDPDRAAVATIAMMDGLQVQWLLNPDAIDMADALADFLRALVLGFDMTSLEEALDAAIVLPRD
ncbi:TetR/AcrR family transcriptional regulator [Microbacterium hominis]|uniref:TetR/AcrR family transcriptional regulator n=1 Tax=Microbacterium hominis TaxID=162426 RepID=A0A7D4PWM3_9MICO|nr:TetR family transcriptional regulator [Microbacterium hominis]QKJ20614.1 TetR/AcrR family transcriptional regulator [Microbacterium hominis]